MKKSIFILSMIATSSNLIAAGRDTINVVGSSTVYPFSTVVAERFGKSTNFKTPKIELTGTGGGMKLFCAGSGIVFANSKKSKQMTITRKELFLALAKEVPATGGSEKLIANPYKLWSDVNPALPATKIEVLEPPPTSGTRDAFVELVLEVGCKQYAWIKAIKKQNKSKYKTICHSVREDQVYIQGKIIINLTISSIYNDLALM